MFCMFDSSADLSSAGGSVPLSAMFAENCHGNVPGQHVSSEGDVLKCTLSSRHKH